MSLVDRAKEVIKQHIRQSQGELVEIPIENVEENVAIFERALNAPDIQRMLVQQHKRVQFRLVQPAIEQAKTHMLAIIRSAGSRVRHIVFPYAFRDCRDATAALLDAEVQAALQERQITAQVKAYKDGKPLPDILIATSEDVASGKLDEYLRHIES